MKFHIKTVILAIGLLSIMCNVALAEKYAPTDKVNEILEAMSELEESYESGNWAEATESAEKLEAEVKEIIEQIKNDDLELQSAVENLQQAIKQRNSESIEIAFIGFQRRFFSLLNDFDYEIHPILLVIEEYLVKEAGEAAEKNDIEEVLSEVRECGNLFRYAKPILAQKGVAIDDLNKCNSDMIRLLMAGKNNEDEKVLELLKEVQGQYKSFMAQVKS